MLKADLHIHTEYSFDCGTSLENIISVQFFAALGAFILLAFIPLIYKRVKKSRGTEGEGVEPL